ncbi:glycoside hydrolase family 18 protein [Roseateles sp.]|uniref:glycoside hydrolase family 18 protein n=1 Tax=Roseateles sp. TaxID=1971397 RepID=UPI0025E8C0E6|nr:glycoside hydrolase family 18 protein [Roseateles sp.]MBV8036033.1 glycoside hydrolase family 18 protein [Roseateles sp.]
MSKILIAALALAASVAQARTPPVVGSYILAERGVDVVEQLQPGRVTHLLYAFLLICGEGQRPQEAAACAGQPAFGIAPHADQQTFSAAFERLKARDPRVQVLASVGGWGGSDPFFHLAASAEGRAAFVKQAMVWLRAHPGFDGLDIDWEHPGSNGAVNGVALGDPADGERYVALLQELRAGLDALGRETGRRYALTSAIATSREQLARMPMGRAARSLDLVFMMTYDFAGPWTAKAAHHTALRSAKPTDDDSLTASVANLKREGVPVSKLVAGVAMYGRGFDGVRADGGYARPWPNEDGSVAFKDIAALQAQGMKPVFDKRTQSWAMVGDGKFVGYDDPRAVRAKAKFARRQGLAGVFAWELSQDNGEILDAMNEAR